MDILLTMFGEAGRRLTEIDACEGAAGNISVCVRSPLDVAAHFPVCEDLTLPQAVPELAGAILIVSGSGRRLREIAEAPTANLGCVVVGPEGNTATIRTAPHRHFERLTSEFNSHLAVHHDRMRASDIRFHALVHAQPVHLTYLSHVSRYQNAAHLNRHLLRWQPETIINLPEGLGVVPFLVPGSPALMWANVEALRHHRVVIWGKHGLMARSDVSVKRAVDCIEYAETAARYEYLNLCSGERGEGLSAKDIRAICDGFNIRQAIF